VWVVARGSGYSPSNRNGKCARDRKVVSEMNKSIIQVLFATAILWQFNPAQAQTWMVTASTRPSQFVDYNTSTYTDSSSSVSTDFSVTSSSSGPSAYAEATASPVRLHAFTSVAGGGIGVVDANASSSFGLTVINSNALRQLGKPGDTSISLLLNFDANVEISVLDDPGIFRQATTTAYTSIFTSQGQSGSGSLNVQNGSYGYSYSGTGAFASFSEIGGNAVISVPLIINFDNPASFTVAVTPYVDSGGSLSLEPPVTDDIQLSIPTLGFITLQDGTSIIDHGAEYTLFPTTMPSVPEPSAFWQVGCGFLAAGVAIGHRKIKEARVGNCQ